MGSCGCGAKKGVSVRQVTKRKINVGKPSSVTKTQKRVVIHRPAR